MSPSVWPVWKRVGFRFVFVYLLLQSRPWTWFADIPGLGWSWWLSEYPW